MSGSILFEVVVKVQTEQFLAFDGFSTRGARRRAVEAEVEVGAVFAAEMSATR